MKAQVLVVDLLSNAIGAYLVLFFLFMSIQGKTLQHKPSVPIGSQKYNNLEIELTGLDKKAHIGLRITPPNGDGLIYETLLDIATPNSHTTYNSTCYQATALRPATGCNHIMDLQKRFQTHQPEHIAPSRPLWQGIGDDGYIHAHKLIIPNPIPGCWVITISYDSQQDAKLIRDSTQLEMNAQFGYSGFDAFTIDDKSNVTFVKQDSSDKHAVFSGSKKIILPSMGFLTNLKLIVPHNDKRKNGC